MSSKNRGHSARFGCTNTKNKGHSTAHFSLQAEQGNIHKLSLPIPLLMWIDGKLPAVGWNSQPLQMVSFWNYRCHGNQSCFPSKAHWNGDGMKWSKGICFLMRQNEMHLNWGMDGNEGKIQSVPHLYILRKSFSSWAEQNYTHAQNVPSRIQNSWANYFQLSWNHSIASMISVEGKND